MPFGIRALTRQAGWLWVWLALSIGGCATPPGGDDGIGGTGIASAGDDGIGGTGIQSNILAGDDGIGGTGINGIVASTAPLVVNGIQIALSNQTIVRTDGAPSELSVIKVGAYVEVTARKSSSIGELIATRIDERAALIGPVTGVNEVMQQPLSFVTGVAHDLDQPDALGQWVRVSGQRLRDGGLVVTNIERIEPRESTIVFGPLFSSSGELRIGSVPLKATIARTAPGTWVAATGQWTGDTLRAASVVGRDRAPNIVIALDPQRPLLTGRRVLQGYSIDITSNVARRFAAERRPGAPIALLARRIEGSSALRAIRVRPIIQRPERILEPITPIRPSAPRPVERPPVTRPDITPRPLPAPIERPTVSDRPAPVVDKPLRQIVR